MKTAMQAAQAGLPMRDVNALGQVFTPASVVERMLTLRRNHGRALEPSCGDGAFFSRIADCVALELDATHCPPGALNLDFFTYPAHEQFATVIGNPPYVAARHILPATRQLLKSRLLDGHANLYLHFIEKSVRHLAPGGEGWLVLSDIAEHLGLRTRDELLVMIASAGLTITSRLNVRPTHRRTSDTSHPLHAARAAEVTSLWRLDAEDG